MIEIKNTITILHNAIRDFDVFPSTKGVDIYINQELDNKVWINKDSLLKELAKLKSNANMDFEKDVTEVYKKGRKASEIFEEYFKGFIDAIVDVEEMIK